MKIRELYKRTVDRLRQINIPDAELEAGFLLRYFLEVDRTGLFLDERQLTDTELENFEGLVLRRLGREPLSYIIGSQEFWSLPFEVAPDVLIPRPETELLIESVLALVANPADFSGKILDLGTGSGIIATVLTLELPGAEVVAVDLSGKALVVAARNIKRHGVADRVTLIKGDWFSPLRPVTKFEFIVSNPPYVAAPVRENLQPELAFEPETALYAGDDGMDAYRQIVPLSRRYLHSSGHLLLEIGYDQEEMIRDLITDDPDLELLWIKKDYSGHARVICARAVDVAGARG